MGSSRSVANVQLNHCLQCTRCRCRTTARHVHVSQWQPGNARASDSTIAEMKIHSLRADATRAMPPQSPNRQLSLAQSLVGFTSPCGLLLQQKAAQHRTPHRTTSHSIALHRIMRVVDHIRDNSSSSSLNDCCRLSHGDSHKDFDWTSQSDANVVDGQKQMLALDINTTGTQQSTAHAYLSEHQHAHSGAVRLKRVLDWRHLLFLGVGSTIGAGQLSCVHQKS